MPSTESGERHPQETFGATLRELRMTDGLRQTDLAGLLGVARSTLANVERGAERPSDRLWQAIRMHRPMWGTHLEHHFPAARSAPRRSSTDWDGEPFLAGPFHIVSISYVYVFEEARSPAEIIEIRRIRATASGADRFGLWFAHNSAPELDIDREALWGGGLRASQSWTEHGGAVHWGFFDFGRRLARGEQHEFAIRTFIERDPDPPTDVSFRVTRPTDEVAIHLSFQGTVRPVSAWRYGPVAHEDVEPGPVSDLTTAIRLGPDAGLSARFRSPEANQWYGVGWQWA